MKLNPNKYSTLRKSRHSSKSTQMVSNIDWKNTKKKLETRIDSTFVTWFKLIGRRENELTSFHVASAQWSSRIPLSARVAILYFAKNALNLGLRVTDIAQRNAKAMIQLNTVLFIDSLNRNLRVSSSSAVTRIAQSQINIKMLWNISKTARCNYNHALKVAD